MQQPPEDRRTPTRQRQFRSARRAAPPDQMQQGGPVLAGSAPQAEHIYPNPRAKYLRALILGAVALVVLVLGWWLTTWYLEQQAERRRLEAEAAERAQHPLYYSELIEENAAIYELDPALVAAVILCESSFDPSAESRVGARGLMQLMPDTADWVAGKVNEPDYSFDKLYTPDVGVRFGSWYLGYLSRRFEGDIKKMVCAYHAGQGNVDAWLRNPEYSADGVTLDVIPTNDTRRYATRVMNAHLVYQKYYYPPALPDEEAGDADADAPDTPAPEDGMLPIVPLPAA